MYKLNDKWFRLTGVPLIALVSHIIFFNRNESGDEKFGFWTIYFISLFEAVIVWEAVRLVIQYFRKKFPALAQTRKRILATMGVATIVTLIIRTINIWVYDKTLLWGYRFPLEGYLHGIFVSVLFVVIIGCIYEAIYYFKMWHRTSVETETLKRVQLQTQLDLIKSQINPHFLFNNFSSLSSLIMEDKYKAVEFVEELATVYRYLLQASEKTITTLKEELQFIRSYFQLVKKRFGDAINLVENIDENMLDFGIPPLTLQLLVENAIKHNAALADKPLIISINTLPKARLSVSNNVQQKSSKAESNKMGLNNIVAKYHLLKEPAVKIEQSQNQFTVTIPLIKSF